MIGGDRTFNEYLFWYLILLEALSIVIGPYFKGDEQLYEY